MDQHIDKKVKMPEEEAPSTNAVQENMFSTVGDVAAQVDDETDQPVQEIESLCMNCRENGTTRLLLTDIPHFRKVVIMSFHCPHCGFKNTEIQSASEIQEKGTRFTLALTDASDLNRQVIRSESCTCKFVELDVEIPPKKGQLTTVEGLLTQIRDDLLSDQPARLAVDPAAHAKIAEFIDRLQQAVDGQMLPMTLIVDDPSGNSWVEYIPGESSHKWIRQDYMRTRLQNIALGMQVDENNAPAPTAAIPRLASGVADVPSSVTAAAASTEDVDNEDIENLHTEVQTFNEACPSCYTVIPSHAKVVNIPHFKDVILMSTVCDTCGYRSNEVKTGGAVSATGRKITLKVEEPDDLTRDILKSETCGIFIPELDLDLTPGTLGGRFTTLEGLLTQVHDELQSRVFNQQSDSMDEATHTRWQLFLGRLDQAIQGQIKFTVIMDDPMAASYIQNVYAPDPDPMMEIVDYERTEEQNEDLGLNDMNV